MKEYGKLTAEQFREFIGNIPSLLKMLREMNSHLARTPSSKFDSVMHGDYGRYSHVYELPFSQHLALVIVGLNRMDEVKEIAAAPDPQEAVLDIVRNRDKVDDKPQHPDFDDEEVVTLAYSLRLTMQSMAVYGRSISSLRNLTKLSGASAA